MSSKTRSRRLSCESLRSHPRSLCLSTAHFNILFIGSHSFQINTAVSTKALRCHCELTNPRRLCSNKHSLARLITEFRKSKFATALSGFQAENFRINIKKKDFRYGISHFKGSQSKINRGFKMFFWGGKLTKLKFMSLNNLPGMRLWNAALSSVSELLQDSVLAGHIKSRL